METTAQDTHSECEGRQDASSCSHDPRVYPSSHLCSCRIGNPLDSSLHRKQKLGAYQCALPLRHTQCRAQKVFVISQTKGGCYSGGFGLTHILPVRKLKPRESKHHVAHYQ